MTPTRRERLEGGVIGPPAGVALGVPYAFHPPAMIPAPSEIEFTSPPATRGPTGGAAGGVLRVPPRQG
jgi:ADP-ribosyl-[dinitrogen reductase] hydrolase